MSHFSVGGPHWVGDLNKLEREVAGEYNTFRVYLYLVKHRSCTISKVQQALQFSTPSLAAYHLNKLVSHGLAIREQDGYGAFPATFGVLKFYIVTGRWIVPKSVFALSTFLSMTAGFGLYLTENHYFLIAFAVSFLGLVWSAYETVQFLNLIRT
jgi:hypothetical protein